MAEEQRDTYEATKARLEEIATAVKKKDVSLEKSIELLEEGVRLANLCTEQVDSVNFVAPPEPDPSDEGEQAGADAGTGLAADSEDGPEEVAADAEHVRADAAEQPAEDDESEGRPAGDPEHA